MLLVPPDQKIGRAGQMGIGFRLLVAMAGAFAGRAAFVPDSLAAKMAEARALGLPLTPAELHLTPVPDSQNGVPLLHRAAELLKKSPTGDSDLTALRSCAVADPP